MNDEVVAPVVNEVVATAVTPETVTTPDPETEAATEVSTPQADEKKFTQKELDEIIQKRIAKADAVAERRALKVYAAKLEEMQRPAQQAQASRTSNDDAPKIEDFQSVDEFLNARDEWRDNKREQAVRQQREAEAHQSINKRVDSILTEAEKIEGFNRDDFEALTITEPMAHTIMESDVSAKLTAYLTANPDEADRIATLSPVRQVAELGKLEIKITTAAQEAKASKVPAPINPIGAKGSGIKNGAELEGKDFAAWRKSFISKRR